MASIKGFGWTFDTVASAYEKFRPGYCDELYKTIFDYCDTDHFGNVLEIGIGGGQATLPFLKTGCSLTAVDCGDNFARLCRDKFSAYPNFNMVTSKFENAELDEDTYDLVYSASAFHWIPEEIGYTKVFSILRKGGVFARFANHPYQDKGNPGLCREINELYAQYYYKYYGKTPKTPTEYTENMAEELARIAEKYGFCDIRHALFYRTRTFSAAEYIMLLGTYSDHLAIEKNIRQEFFSKIEHAIERNGGSITVYDTIDLQLARKREA